MARARRVNASDAPCGNRAADDKPRKRAVYKFPEQSLLIGYRETAMEVKIKRLLPRFRSPSAARNNFFERLTQSRAGSYVIRGTGNVPSSETYKRLWQLTTTARLVYFENMLMPSVIGQTHQDNASSTFRCQGTVLDTRQIHAWLTYLHHKEVWKRWYAYRRFLFN